MSLMQQDDPQELVFQSLVEMVLIWSAQGLQLLNGRFGQSDACTLQGQASSEGFEADAWAPVTLGHVAVQVLHSLLKLSSNLAGHPGGLPASFMLAICRTMEPIYDLQVDSG